MTLGLKHFNVKTLVTIETSWPLDVIFVGEHVVSLAGEGHVPLVEVVLEPVVLGARATDVENRLSVRWRVVRVPLQLKIVFAVTTDINF